jgi:hypothetical protein
MVSSPFGNCPDASRDDLKGDSEMNHHDLITAPLAKFSSQVPPRGRRIKFTPERIQQIRNLVERGKSREEIAELIEVTVGSLQVTCSKLGISLRRPRLDNGIRFLTRGKPVPRNGRSTSDPSCDVTILIAMYFGSSVAVMSSFAGALAAHPEDASCEVIVISWRLSP